MVLQQTWQVKLQMVVFCVLIKKLEVRNHCIRVVVFQGIELSFAFSNRPFGISLVKITELTNRYKNSFLVFDVKFYP